MQHRPGQHRSGLLLLLIGDDVAPSAFAAAGPLAQAPVSSSPSPASDQAVRRLHRWRSGEPFSGADDPLWHARLDAAGLDEQRLLDTLSGEDGTPGSAASWEADALRVLADAEAAERGRAAHADSGDYPFLALAEPFAGDAIRGLLRDIEPGARHSGLGDPDTIVAQLAHTSLLPRLNAMCQRVMLLDLAVARQTGVLVGDTPRERLANFVAGLREPTTRRATLLRYPLLTRQLTVVSGAWRRACAELLDRLVRDRPRLRDVLGADGAVVEVVAGLGDHHRDARAVASVRFANGVTVVYKPRPVAVDAHFQDLLRWVNARVPGLDLRTLSFVSDEHHGWSEFVEPAACVDDAGITRFYRRQGALLALLYLLHANDVHAENLIAVGEQPVLVDLETLLQPELVSLQVDGESPVERTVRDLTSGSVLHAGLLPAGSWQTARGEAADLSGLGWTAGQRSPIQLPTLHGAGTDDMRLGLGRHDLGSPTHRPTGAADIRLLDYAEDILGGFTDVYRVLLEHRDELAGPSGPLAAFAGDQVRVLIRDTVTYGLLLTTSFHPDVLRRGTDRDRHFDHLWRDAATRPGLGAVIEHERGDLWRNDIPVFAARADSDRLLDSGGAEVAGVEMRSGLAVSADILAGFCDDDLHRQRWLVRSCLATNAFQRGETQTYAYYDLAPRVADVDARRYLAAAHKVADRLRAVAIRADGHALWVGPHRLRPRTWSVGGLSPTMYDGTLSVAFFLAHHADLTGDRDSATLAREAVRAAVRQIDRGALRRVHGTTGGDFGGLCGLGGMVYALTHLGALWDDDRLLDTAVDLAGRLGATVEHDTEYAVTDGAAGSILALAALYRVRPSGALRDLVRQAGDHLVEQQRPWGSGAAWVPRLFAESGIADRPLAGFAHGTAGIVTALLTAADLLGEERYRVAARLARAHLHDLVDPDGGDWLDVRSAAESAPAFVDGPRDVETERTGWCHGAPGIGIAALHAAPLLDDPTLAPEVDRAVALTVERGFGFGLSQCHGDFGSLELLRAAAVAGHPRAIAEVDRHAAGILDVVEGRGWVSGLPTGVEIVGFFSGIAGIGYGLLRCASPDTTPSVLAMEPPRR